MSPALNLLNPDIHQHTELVYIGPLDVAGVNFIGDADND